MQHESAEDYFNEPVDADELELPNYHNIIKVRASLRTFVSTLCRPEAYLISMESEKLLIMKRCQSAEAHLHAMNSNARG